MRGLLRAKREGDQGGVRAGAGRNDHELPARFRSVCHRGEDSQNIAPSKAWERGIPNERMKPFERNPTGESPVRLEP